MERIMGRDWRSPGYSWVKTAEGWRSRHAMQPASVPEEVTDIAGRLEEGSPAAATAASDRRYHNRNNFINQLCHCCITINPKSSRECHKYVTIGEMLTKLKFECAVGDHNCIPFICEVLRILLYFHWQQLSNGMQSQIIRILAAVKLKALATRMHYGVTVKLMKLAFIAVQKNVPFHRQERSNNYVKILDGWNHQLCNTKFQDETGSATSLTLVSLPLVALVHVIHYLSDPLDILHLGMAHSLLHSLTEQPSVWHSLSRSNYSKEANVAVAAYINTIDWKRHYKVLHRMHCTLATESVLVMCDKCNGLFWKFYGHPCIDSTGGCISSVSPQKLMDLMNF